MCLEWNPDRLGFGKWVDPVEASCNTSRGSRGSGMSVQRQTVSRAGTACDRRRRRDTSGSEEKGLPAGRDSPKEVVKGHLHEEWRKLTKSTQRTDDNSLLGRHKENSPFH